MRGSGGFLAAAVSLLSAMPVVALGHGGQFPAAARFRLRGRRYPHDGLRQCARYSRQIAAGRLTVSNGLAPPGAVVPRG
jgi:hypothetical protein